MGQSPTLKKISEQLNLSISTVSRALKDHPDISEATRKKVKELAALMDYEPNALAVNLRTNKSRVIGLIVPSIVNTFNESFIAAAENEARKAGYSLMILQSGDEPIKEYENLKLCKNYRVDGVLISVATGSTAETFRRYMEFGVPIVFFDRVPDSNEYDTVCMADEAIASLSAKTILQYRKKKVLALFGIPELLITRKRKDAFLQTLSASESAPEVELIFCRNSIDAEMAVEKSLQGNPHPDHIFCMSDEILIGTIRAIYHSGLTIPGDISVLSISNGFIPGLINPEITYIETSGAELGRLAIGRLLENLREKTAPKSIQLPSRFVQGQSL